MADKTRTAEMNDKQFERYVLELLARELGPGDFARYLMLFRSGKGDFTADRQHSDINLTVDDFWKQMEADGLVAK